LNDWRDQIRCDIVALMKEELTETGNNSLDELLGVGVISMPITVPEVKQLKDLHMKEERRGQTIQMSPESSS